MSNYLPEELLVEILSRVSAKSLVSFLLVSKSWYTLITSPNFITTHLNNVRQQKVPSNSSLFLIRRYTNYDRKEHYTIHPDDEQEGGGDSGRNRDFARKSIELDFPLKSQVGYFRVVGTCDGLVCLCDDLFTIRKPIYLWNPSVRKYLELPSPSIDPPFPHMFVLGFGADLHGDYKVVRIVYNKEDLFDFTLPPEVEVYSLSMGSWRRIVNFTINVFITEFLWSQAFFNGAVHWISYGHRWNVNGGPFSSLILRFDMVNELFNEIMLPDELSCLLATKLVINVYRGSLAVVGYHSAEENGYCSIWVMKQYGVFESWTRLFTIDLVDGMERVIGFQNDNVLVAKGRSDDVVILDPKTNEIQELGVFGIGTPRSFYGYDFEETLVLLGRQNVNANEEEESKDDHDFQEVGENNCDEESSTKSDDSHGQERITEGMSQLSCL